MTTAIRTTKVSNALNSNDVLTIIIDGMIINASKREGEMSEVYNRETGDFDIEISDDCYELSFHNGAMPAFETRQYPTIEAVARAMKDNADLRTWKIAKYE